MTRTKPDALRVKTSGAAVATAIVLASFAIDEVISKT
jgi:hypothetical protein